MQSTFLFIKSVERAVRPTKTFFMKKIVLFTTILMIFLSAKSQVNIINVDNNKKTETKEYFIHGISTREAIGGVEASYTDRHEVYLENYRNFPVTVLYEVFSGSCPTPECSGSCVLKAGEKKKVAYTYQYIPNKTILIVRKL